MKTDTLTTKPETPAGLSSSVLLGVQDRQKVIEALFDEMTSSSFAEGCEERIARGLEARTDAQLLELAKSKMTWTPNVKAHPPLTAQQDSRKDAL